jgi:hypothetical protein
MARPVASVIKMMIERAVEEKALFALRLWRCDATGQEVLAINVSRGPERHQRDKRLKAES